MNAKTYGKQKGKGQRQAIVWGRFSSAQQSDGDSRERQERLNREYAKREGIHIVAEYFDEASSVKDGATPLFKKVLASLPNGVGIVTENLDRINRGHPWRAKAYIADLLEAGHFIITSQDGREYTAESIAELDTLVIGDISANVAYAENSKRIKRVREAKAQAVELARQGKPSPLGAWLPSHIRFNFETKHYDFNQDIADITERIFREYIQGKGTSNIARGLNHDGIPTFGSKKVGAWTRSSIAELLRYEGTIGILNHKGERIPNAWKPALDQKLFYKVQGMLEQNTNRHGNYTAERVNNVFRGICHCSKCGSPVKAVKNGSYLQCMGHVDGKCSVSTMVRFPELERDFLQWFIPSAKDALLGVDESQSSINTLTAKQNALQKRIEATIELLDGGVAVNEIQKRLTRLETERQAIENEIAEAKAKHSHNATMPDAFKELQALTDNAITGNQEARKRIASVIPSMVQNVIIDLDALPNTSFEVHLTDGQILKWEYNFEEYRQPITESGELGKGKFHGGYYERK